MATGSTCLGCGAEVIVAVQSIVGYASVFDPNPSDQGRAEIDFVRGRWHSLTPDQDKRKPGPDERRYRFHRCAPK
jgi:hypothetical protein